MTREQGRNPAVPGAEPALRPGDDMAPPGALAEMFRAAVAQHQARNFVEAERQLRQILVRFPGHAETHHMLGATLMVQGRTTEAIAHFEQAVAQNPGGPHAYEALAGAYLTAGKADLAVHAAARALQVKETPQGKILFAQAVARVRYTADNDGRFRELVLRALTEDWARPRELGGSAVSLIRLNGAVNDAITRVTAAWPVRLSAAELFGAGGMAALSGDALLCRLLEHDPVSDVGLERLLTNVRHVMLTAAAADGTGEEPLLALYCAIARQCFINEYVYATTEAEADQAQQLRGTLEKALAGGAPCSTLWPVAVGAYFPLHGLAKADALLDRPWPECVKALFVQQVEEPAQEHRTAATIPVLTEIDGEVSRAVRLQYEENPYPRWTRTKTLEQPVTGPQPQQAFDVLIAGCGTGLSTIEFARRARTARILAVDLSRASLGYAKRMAESFALTNVEFGQADIVKLGAIGRQFDFIDASGVLHHLADPWAGWRTLLSLLRPGGAMQIGLYSELGRRNIVAARALIAERGYRPVPDDIRRCRDYIIAADDPVLQSVTQWHDFFTINECRDLLFHVQEHRTTLPEIKSFLAQNGAEFAGFMLDGSILQRFAARFPAPSNMLDLDCWARFETEAPQTFAAMYQFWLRKPAAPPGNTAAQ